MRRLRALNLFATAILASYLIAPSRLAAQQATPRLPFSDVPVNVLEAERILAERFGRSVEPLLMERSLRKILEHPEYYGLTPEALKNMMPGDFRRNPQDFGIDPFDQRWREKFPNMPLPQPKPMGGGNEPVPPLPVPPERPEPKPPDRPPEVGGVDPARPMPPPVEPVRPQGGGNGGGNRPGPRNVGGSGRMQDMLRNFVGGNAGLRDWARDFKLDARQFTRNAIPRLDGLRLDFGRNFGNLVPRGIKGPSFSGVSLPSVGGSLPSLSLSSGGSLGKGLLIVVIIIIAGVAIFFVVRLVRDWIPAELLARWRLGPWPVQPGEVSTRGELIQAFEYLALLKLGRSAGAAHHKSIANRLASPQADPFTANRAMAAEELGDLYEQARYAPPDEDLSPHQLAAARTDLCLLAGVSAA